MTREDMMLIEAGIVPPRVRDQFTRRRVREYMSRDPMYRALDSFTRNNLHDKLLFDQGRALGMHHMIVRDAEGRVKNELEFPNLITTVGKAHMLNVELDGTTTRITTWYLSLVGIPQSAPAGSVATDVGGVLNTGSVANSTTLTTGTSVTIVQNQLITVFGAMTGGGAFVGSITSASGTAQSTCTLSGTATGTASSLTTVYGPLFVVGDTMASHINWAEIAAANLNGTPTNRSQITFNTTATNAISNSSAVTYTMVGSLSGTQYLYGVFITSNQPFAGTAGTLFSEAAPSVGALGVQASYQISDTYTLTLN